MPDKFILHSEYSPTGDQPQAIEALAGGFSKMCLYPNTRFTPKTATKCRFKGFLTLGNTI